MNILEYENLHETMSHEREDFPYNTYLCSIPLDFSLVPLHWHDELEIIYIKKGIGLIQIDLKTYQVKSGNFALILPGQLHGISQWKDYPMEYENIIFHPDMLIPKKSDATANFLKPLFEGQASVPSIFTPDMDYYSMLLSCVDANDDICKDFPPAYQLFIKGQLFMFFYFLCSQGMKAEPEKRDVKSLDKIRTIIKYVENNYAGKITIADVAEEVGLSESHFMKFFKNTMGTSFVDYLNDYRLTMASRLLLSSDSAILDIAAECGFDNLSYFNRIFKRKFNRTPREYRKK